MKTSAASSLSSKSPDLPVLIQWNTIVHTKLYSCGGPKAKGFLGHSSVSMPFKGVVTRIEGPNEEMRVVDIDLDILQVRPLTVYRFFGGVTEIPQDARAVYKIREDYEAKIKLNQ